MMNVLPTEFLTEIKKELNGSFDEFLATYEQPAVKSLRTNIMKVSPKSLENMIPFHFEPIPWCPDGFYFPVTTRPGKHVYHAAGLYYIQEASAMAPVEALQPKPSEKILDMCAAPGGKTTQIAAKMNGEGILVANEVDGKRCKVLISNLERFGVTNAVVLNEQPHRFSERFTAYFDRILVDAPCSGEGMFRKDPEACEHWSIKNSEKCADLQQYILTEAAKMLKPGGRLVYSTCTFNRRENEYTLENFLRNHPDFELIEVPNHQHFQNGLTDSTALASRLWPHLLRGEGHFLAVLQKKQDIEEAKIDKKSKKGIKNARIPKQISALFEAFIKDTFVEPMSFSGNLVLYGDHLYETPLDFPNLDKCKVAQPGRYLGEIRKGRFLPSHAWAMALQANSIKQVQSYQNRDRELYRFLQGETVPTTHKGWTLVTVDGYALGWGKGAAGILKNHYPKWLRFAYDQPK
ncbi:RsmB/NOP family class I SAM-dependent RNA methyltransferase [Shimazuella sp. AN120528]|uniref:RsmB/NOP family class I SAM-dependent RNA methyltransferase n=1 Tax=Shimazuella soli TaxID=1892854 RepID=UPI001F0F77A7|nr:RsmB/NOP family class I SAM-dependent RNA methyltransferase [Shimazuella soli]MCH5584500.1 RsmB/NOP family class I SAM-dependent RNA methyltransferase [Shimazuella soli]